MSPQPTRQSGHRFTTKASPKKAGAALAADSSRIVQLHFITHR